MKDLNGLVKAQGVLPNGLDSGLEYVTYPTFKEDCAGVMKVIVDPYDNVVEVDETNNEKILGYNKCFRESGKPDLVVRSLKMVYPNDGNGRTLFEAVIGNVGKKKAHNIDWKLSAGNSQTVHTASLFGPFSELNEGGEIVFYPDIKLLKCPVTVDLEVDFKNTIVEENENNNKKSIVFNQCSAWRGGR